MKLSSNMYSSHMLSFSIIFCLFLTNCGKKPHSIIPQQEVECVPKPPKLSFPAVRGITLLQTKKGNLISWNSIEQPKDASHIGYQIYRFAEGGFLSKKCLDKVPPHQSWFLDINPSKQYRWLYLVRPLFLLGPYTIEGPTSQVIAESNK